VTATVALPLMVGARTLWTLKRRLVRLPLRLEDALAAAPPRLPPLQDGADGYLVSSLPAAMLGEVLSGTSLRPFVRQRYRRSYAELDGSFDTYLAGFSAKSRSTLRRKVRKFAERSGGAIDLRLYSAPSEMAQFYRHARAVSQLTYQERLLGAGLPDGPDALARMEALARRDSIRGWLLFLDGRPVSYLHAPAEGDTLVYAHLGYDPDIAELSPGTVLQFEVMRQLVGQRRFRLFDFTEGEGQHKRQFGTADLDCLDLLLLRGTLPNLAAGHGLNAFDSAVAAGKKAVLALGLEKLARAVRR
jgi:CelD/BcsL family acetyltransferase involved in cellulose biosynthesis